MQKPQSPIPTQLKPVALIGYSGHAWVVADALLSQGRRVMAYCELEPKEENPFSLAYLGSENDPTVLAQLREYDCFVAIGANELRRRVTENLLKNGLTITGAIHATAVVSGLAKIGAGAFLGPFAVVNAGAEIGVGAVCNTAAVIEHQCRVGNYAHIGPGAVLAGHVEAGSGALIGAGAVVRPGVIIGENALIGAGSVVVANISDNFRVAGNPAKALL